LQMERGPESGAIDRSRSLGPVPSVRVDGHLPAAGGGELRVMQRCGTMRCEALVECGPGSEWQTEERRRHDDSIDVEEGWKIVAKAATEGNVDDVGRGEVGFGRRSLYDGKT
jgi:hypothetical protein